MDMTESLFSLEVHVESVNRLKVSCIIPAVSFRLLDFPTLIIHYVSPGNVQKLREKSHVHGITKNYIEGEFRDRYGNIPIAKGKSCLFKANILTLQSQLQHTPLYVMLLDVWSNKPKLVGSTMIPLKNTIDKIAADVERLGASVPSISQLEGTYEVYNLMGSIIGSINLGLRVLSLGGCLAPHIPAKSIMTRASEKNIEHKETKVEIDEVNLEVIDEELSTKPSTVPVLQSAATQTNVQVLKAPKSVVHTRSPYMEDTESEWAIITNTVCPPPLYYHFKSHTENTGNKIERNKVEGNNCSISPHITSEDVDFTYYKPDLVQPDGTCGCASVYVQTEGVQDSQSSLPVSKEESTEWPEMVGTRINSEDLPLLSALLEELTYLRTCKGDTRETESSKPLKEPVTVPPKEPPNLRECCSRAMAQKSAVSRNQRTKMAVLTQKRVKFKQTSLTYGMTKTQLMRLEMNQKRKQQIPRLCTAINEEKNTSTSHVPSHKQLSQGTKSSGSHVKRDLGRTHTVFPRPGEAEERNVVSTEVQTDNDFTMVITKDENDAIPDGSSTRSIMSSPNSVDIYLPQMEGESDASGVFDVTNLDAEDRFAPYSTYKKYGHTGIPDLPATRKSPDQSEPTGKSLHQSDLTRKSLDQSDSMKKSPDQSEPSLHQSDMTSKSPDQSEPTRSSPDPLGSARKSPELTRRRSVTSQIMRSRTSTALSMYSDDFEECPVWDSPGPSEDESSNNSSSSSSKSHTSYHSADSQATKDKEREARNDHNEPIKSYYSPLKSKDKHSSSKSSTPEERSLPPDEQQCSKTTDTNKEHFYDSLNSEKSRGELSDSEKEGEQKNVSHLPKPANEMGYTF